MLLKGYGPKWHHLTSSGCQISILRVHWPKWHLGTSSRAAGVFNSLCNSLPLVDNASIKVQQCKRSAKHAMKRFNLQSFSNRPKALKYATSELKLEKRVISKHSKPS